ncbi:zinc-ribbon domain-containing protein [Salinadaptatus halalkaliphilus]
MFEGVNWLLARTFQNEVVYECRRCGTTVDEDTETCPACGADAIVQHQIS